MLCVKKGSGSFKAGDIIFEINGRSVRDIIDLRFYADTDNKLVIQRENKRFTIYSGSRQVNSLTFKQEIPGPKRCLNSCLFCFLKQLPKGLRKSLYFNDDDWRLSFLTGNFVTLTNLSSQELKKIKQQKISPLYVSIHSTDAKIRDRLGLKKQDYALDVLGHLDNEGIVTHLQIVLCPGINDGQVLLKSLEGLQNFRNVKSVGIVPVGLTRYHRNGLRTFSAGESRKLVEVIGSLQSKYRVSRGSNWVYLADEFYLMAAEPLPENANYDDFDQLENGIGLVRKWLNELMGLPRPHRESLAMMSLRGAPSGRRDNLESSILITGKLFEPLLKETLGSLGLEVKVQAIENNFFGSKITVAGLITAQDIIKQVKPTKEPVLIPDIMVNEDNLFLDNISFSELKKSLSSAILIPSSGKQFADWLKIHLLLPIPNSQLPTLGVS